MGSRAEECEAISSGEVRRRPPTTCGSVSYSAAGAELSARSAECHGTPVPVRRRSMLCAHVDRVTHGAPGSFSGEVGLGVSSALCKLGVGLGRPLWRKKKQS